MSTIDPTSVNPAVLRCLQAFKLRYDAERAKGISEGSAASTAAADYCRAMPHLHGRKNIQDFIACICHGMLVGTIYPRHASGYLYAAQIALNSLAPEPRPLGRPAATPEPAQPESSAPVTEPKLG